MKYILKSIPGIVCLLFIVSCGGKQNGQVADSLDSSYLEEGTVDSAYLDSVARRNFKSYDLTFNELHGDVKEVRYQTPTYLLDITKCNFDEDGNWLNAPEWTKEDKIYNNKYCPGEPDHQTIRDKEGRISKIYFACETDWDYIEYKWDNENLKGNSMGDFRFSDDGFLMSWDEDDIQLTKYIYSDYVLDGMGNWIERTVNSFTYDEDFAIEKEERKERREIIYYHSKPQGKFPLVNSSAQVKLLADERNKYKKAEQSTKQQQYSEEQAYTANHFEISSPRQSSEPKNAYSTPEGREAYLEVLKLQSEVKELINASAKYRRILSYSTDPYEYQMAGIENASLLQEAVKKQRRAISIAERTLKDPTLLKELNGQLQLLMNELYK